MVTYSSDHLPHPQASSVAVILGSAFSASPPQGVKLNAIEVMTPWGSVVIHQVIDQTLTRPAYLLFRHGLPHHCYPQQVNFRAQAVALKILGCQALLVTSSVGVLDAETPLDQPLLVQELLMPDNRLPDGSLCTVLVDPPSLNDNPSVDLPALSRELMSALQPGHLVLRGPLCSAELNQQVRSLIERDRDERLDPVTFAYVAGPRTKTAAENRYWSSLGAQVNSMSVGPELVLANELEIPTSALVIGHKRSSGGREEKSERRASHQPASHQHNRGEQAVDQSADHREMSETLRRSHQVIESIVVGFIRHAKQAPFPHYIYRYHSDDR